MKRLVFTFALLALLAVPAPAMAKELTKVEVCGADGCAAITGKTNLQNFGGSGEPDGSAAAPAPFYEIRYTIDAEGESSQWSSWYVPSANRLATVDERTGVAWAPIDEPRLAALAKTLKPFARPDITSVTIGSRKVTDDPSFVPPPLHRRVGRRGSAAGARRLGAGGRSTRRARPRGRWIRPACSTRRRTGCFSAASRS